MLLSILEQKFQQIANEYYGNVFLELILEYAEQIKEYQKRELDKAKELSKLKDEFVFVAAHELRTPVTAIRGFIEMIREEKLNPNAKENLKEISRAIDRLHKLVGDLLEVARSEAGRIKINVSSNQITGNIKDTLKEFRPLLKEKKIDLIYKSVSLPPVLVDADKLKEILVNLISNAIKYTPEGGVVTIGHKLKDNQLATFIKDTGAGIPKKDFPKIFSKFYRSEQGAVRSQEGTGLGLFIVKELVEKMNGKIWFESKDGIGSIFYFMFPLAKLL